MTTSHFSEDRNVTKYYEAHGDWLKCRAQLETQVDCDQQLSCTDEFEEHDVTFILISSWHIHACLRFDGFLDVYIYTLVAKLLPGEDVLEPTRGPSFSFLPNQILLFFNLFFQVGFDFVDEVLGAKMLYLFIVFIVRLVEIIVY